MNPNVKNVYPVPVNGVKFVVMAFRKLTKQEMLISIADYFRRTKKKTKPGSEIIILTIIQ